MGHAEPLVDMAETEIYSRFKAHESRVASSKEKLTIREVLQWKTKKAVGIRLTPKSSASSASSLLQLPLHPSQAHSTYLSSGVLKSIAFLVSGHIFQNWRSWPKSCLMRILSELPLWFWKTLGIDDAEDHNLEGISVRVIAISAQKLGRMTGTYLKNGSGSFFPPSQIRTSLSLFLSKKAVPYSCLI